MTISATGKEKQSHPIRRTDGKKRLHVEVSYENDNEAKVIEIQQENHLVKVFIAYSFPFFHRFCNVKASP